MLHSGLAPVEACPTVILMNFAHERRTVRSMAQEARLGRFQAYTTRLLDAGTLTEMHIWDADRICGLQIRSRL